MATLNASTSIGARDACIFVLRPGTGLNPKQAGEAGYVLGDDGFWHDTTGRGYHWPHECTTCRILAIAPMEGPPEKDGTYPDGLPFP